MNHNINRIQRDINECPIEGCDYCDQLRLRIREQQIFDRENAPKFPSVTQSGNTSEPFFMPSLRAHNERIRATFGGGQPYSPEAVNPDRVGAPFQSPGLGGIIYPIPVKDCLCAGVDVASGQDKTARHFYKPASVGDLALQISALKASVEKLNEEKYSLGAALNAANTENERLRETIETKNEVIRKTNRELESQIAFRHRLVREKQNDIQVEREINAKLRQDAEKIRQITIDRIHSFLHTI